MSERPTPRTDAAMTKIAIGDNYDFNYVPTDFARTLERENAELREALAELTPLANIHQAQPENMTELDYFNLLGAIEKARAVLAATKGGA